MSTTSEGRRAEIRERAALSALQIKPGDAIEWQVVAWDNRRDFEDAPAYQQAMSRWRRIVVRDPSDLAKTEPEPEPEPEEAKEQTLDKAEESEGPEQAGGQNDPLSDFEFIQARIAYEWALSLD